MLRLLSKSLTHKFCLNNRLKRIYDVGFQIKDVSLIKGMKTKKPYIEIQDKKVQIPIQQLAFTMNEQLPEEEHFIFFDKDLNIYHPTTPLAIICQETFFIKRKADVYCILNNYPLVYLNKKPELDPAKCSRVVQALTVSSINDLPQNDNQLITGPAVHNILITNILRESIKFKIDKIRIKQILKVVNRQIQKFQLQIKELEYSLRRKANRRLKLYTGFLIFQYIVMHYYIYVHLSWDIMEPITVLFANFDILVGYLFFVLRGRQWGYQQLHGSFIQQNKYNTLKSNGIKVEKYDQLLRIREYLNFRYALLSKNPPQLMQRLQKPIFILDTR